jgi:hypothetical protein
LQRNDKEARTSYVLVFISSSKPSISNTVLVFTCTDAGIKYRPGWPVMAVFFNMDVDVKCGAGMPRRFY